METKAGVRKPPAKPTRATNGPSRKREADGGEGQGGQGDEGAGGGQEVVERGRSKKAGIEDGDRGRSRRLAEIVGFGAHPLRDAEQHEAEDDAEADAHGRRQPALLDRVFDQEHAGERQSDATQPAIDAATEAAFEILPLGGFGGCRRNGSRGFSNDLFDHRHRHLRRHFDRHFCRDVGRRRWHFVVGMSGTTTTAIEQGAYLQW